MSKKNLNAIGMGNGQQIFMVLSALLILKTQLVEADLCTNYTSNTGKTLYNICNVNKVFDDSVTYCQNLPSSPGSFLVKFTSIETFNFILQIMQNYSATNNLPDLIIFIGLQQCRGTNPLVAYSQIFCWLRDGVNNTCSCGDNRIQNGSTTYYTPVQKWIESFATLSISDKSMRTFTMNQNGNQLSGDVFNTGFPINATVMCENDVTSTTTGLTISPGTTTTSSSPITSIAQGTTVSSTEAQQPTASTGSQTIATSETTTSTDLSQMERIALGVGIAGGIIVIVIGAGMGVYKRHKSKRVAPHPERSKQNEKAS